MERSSAGTETAVASEPYPTRDEAAAAFAAHVNRGKVAALQAIGVDIVIGEREGARFRDAYDGRWFWNCHCNGGVFNLGHRNPVVAAALREALDHLDVGNHHLISGWRAELAGRLAASTGGLLPYALFTPSGSEAVDLALTLARGHTGRQKIVAATGAYHGLAGLARAASDPRWSEPYGGPLPGFAHVPFNDLERLGAELGGGRRGGDPRVDPRHARLPAARARIPARGGRARPGRTARCSSSTRCRPVWAAPAPPGTTSRRTPSPTS